MKILIAFHIIGYFIKQLEKMENGISGEWNKWRLEKIENFPCNNDIEAREREQ